MILPIDEVWEMIREKEGKCLKTYSGLDFSYTVKGHELFKSL